MNTMESDLYLSMLAPGWVFWIPSHIYPYAWNDRGCDVIIKRRTMCLWISPNDDRDNWHVTITVWVAIRALVTSCDVGEAERMDY